MSYKPAQICRKFSLILCFMLFLQALYCQYNFNKADDWMKDNLNDLGGRSVLILVKDGKVIYEKAENDLSRKQKMIGKFIAKRQGRQKGRGKMYKELKSIIGNEIDSPSIK